MKIDPKKVIAIQTIAYPTEGTAQAKKKQIQRFLGMAGFCRQGLRKDRQPHHGPPQERRRMEMGGRRKEGVGYHQRENDDSPRPTATSTRPGVHLDYGRQQTRSRSSAMPGGPIAYISRKLRGPEVR